MSDHSTMLAGGRGGATLPSANSVIWPAASEQLVDAVERLFGSPVAYLQ